MLIHFFLYTRSLVKLIVTNVKHQINENLFDNSYHFLCVNLYTLQARALYAEKTWPRILYRCSFTNCRCLLWEGGRTGFRLVRSTPSTCFVRMGETCPTAFNAGSPSNGILSLQIIYSVWYWNAFSVWARNRNLSKVYDS